MEVVIYRNIYGIIETIDLQWWKSFASQFGLDIKEHMTINTITITIYLKAKSACITIYRSGSTHHLSLEYLRLEFEDLPLVSFIDLLIYRMRLSGEKHIINAGPCTEVTYFSGGKVVDSDKRISPSNFDLFLLKEVIFGQIHLALDELINAKRSGNSKKVEEIKKMFHKYQEQLLNLNQQLNL